jgi:hypothetical protein
MLAASVSHRAFRLANSKLSISLKRIRQYSAVSSVKRNTLFDLKKKYAENKPLTLVTSYSAYESALIGTKPLKRECLVWARHIITAD